MDDRVRIDVSMTIIPPQSLHTVWDQAGPLLQKAVDESHGDVSMNSLREQLIAGNQKLMCVFDEGLQVIACITIQVATMESGKRVLLVPMVGGERMSDWLPGVMDQLKEMKKVFICDEIRGIGRYGWIRELKKYGWKPTSVFVSLED
jgi:hypothetical protein